MKNQVQVTSNLIINLQELTNFIREAKTACYASEVKYQINSATQAKSMEYRHGNWRYTDTYHGSFMAPGKEQVGYSTSTSQNQPAENYLPIWEMFYAGGMMPLYWQDRLVSDLTYKLLKKALSCPPVDMPVRGPRMFGIDDEGLYTTKIDGDVTLFGGTEEIWLKSDSINNLTGSAYRANQMVRTFRQIISGCVIVYDHAKV